MLMFTLGQIAGIASAQELRLDPKLVKGPDACGECHKESIAAWKKTHHATTFKNLPRSKDSKKIAKAMGLRRIKSSSDCLTCHFTSAIAKRGKVKPIAGITCESCHGAGADWIKVHSDYGGKGKTAKNEDPGHKKARWTKSVAAGMIRPGTLYQVANNCYGCHTVPNEKLVNVGGHAAGSAFELVSWTQGEVRHNVWYSKENNPASANRKRMMYVVGKMLDLEHALRGGAKATQAGKYVDSMAKRAAAAQSALEAIAGKIKAAEIGQAIAAAKGVKVSPNVAAKLNAAAGKVAAAAKALASNNDGSAFGGVDSMIPGPDKYKGKAP
jgi:hypothetical protein